MTEPGDLTKDAVSIPSKSCDLLYRFSSGISSKYKYSVVFEPVHKAQHTEKEWRNFRDAVCTNIRVLSMQYC